MAVIDLIPSIVGALACQKDSYLQTLETEVVSCNEHVPPKEPLLKAKSKGKKAASLQEATEGDASTPSKIWLVECTDSVLFPEGTFSISKQPAVYSPPLGGGQPTDHGSITPLFSLESGSVPVTNVQRHGLRCICYSSKRFSPGTRIRQDVNFARRWDHMQQHTGQHLLSAIMDSLDLPTLSWSMGAAEEMNYIELPRKPSYEEMRSIQDRCNRFIRENVAITVEVSDKADNAKKLPDDYDKEKGVVRFIRIGDLDYNACCGTHLKQTSHIGLILLHHLQAIRGTNCRLYFSAGDRAINLATASIDAVRNVAMSLSSGSGTSDVVNSVQRLSDTSAEAKKKEKKMLAEIAQYEGSRIRSTLQSGKAVWCYRATDGLDFINLVVFEVKDSVKECGIAVLVSGEVPNTGSIVILGQKDLVEIMAAKAKEAVSTLKGGGRDGKWQGKITTWKKGEIEALRVAVEDL